MFCFNLFVNPFILLLFKLSTGAETTMNLSPGHAKAGNYSWDSDYTCGLLMRSRSRPQSPLQSRPQSRIRNGTRAELGEFPWMANMFAVYWDPKNGRETPLIHRCGGVIVSDYWILTSGLCVPNSNDLRWLGFRVGSKYKYESFLKPNAMVYFTRHIEFDIALVRVQKRIGQHFIGNGDKYRINRACIPVYGIINNKPEEALISGFGQIDEFKQEQAWQLRKAKYVIETSEFCKKYNLNENQICAPTQDNIICDGDQGSGLIQFDGPRAVVIGIATRQGPDPKRCGAGWVEFTRVSSVVGWIENVIKNDKPGDWEPPKTIRPSTSIEPNTSFASELPANVETSKEPEDSNDSNDCNRLNDKTISIFISMVFILKSFL